MPEKTNKAGLNGSKIAVLLILGFVNAIMYCFPYVRYVFYDQQIAAMKITNEQSGILMSAYSLAMLSAMIPGGILADKLPVKKAMLASIFGSFVLILIYIFTMDFKIACVIWFLCGLTTNFVFCVPSQKVLEWSEQTKHREPAMVFIMRHQD